MCQSETAHLATLKYNNIEVIPSDTAVAEISSWDQANRGEKLGLVWRNKKKISQIINNYL